MINEKSKRILILQKILRVAAILVLKKYNPKIISITGSVGKTSTKEAISAVLASKFRVRRTEKNYNNEIGLPLTIIGATSGESSLLGWFLVFLRWLWIMLAPIEYPEILVLEMGADRPGDIQYLTSFIKSNAGVITDISYSHVEYFKNIEGVAKEKGILVKELDEKGLAVLNADNEFVAKLKNQIKCNAITFGFSDQAEMRASDVCLGCAGQIGDLKGLSFKLNYKGTTIPVRLNNILAKHQIYAVLAAVSIGDGFGINLVEAGSALENFSSPVGRMNLLSGIKNTHIIDDTYNSSPTSSVAALEALGEIKSNRKIAVLGDMLELGDESKDGHRSLGDKFIAIGGDIFLAVGKRMKKAGEELEKNNFPVKNIFYFESPDEAGKKLREIMQTGDLILVKGSQGMRMEKLVEEVMSDPTQAKKLLCRQTEKWRTTGFSRSI
ncbi:MAG: UDP-N-acetylmuramoyl-tripeptide-D-alanyl-D-alanine ligase [Candidatus Moranbacteria bacterium GW2011_GWA2_39_41]|nr:MAG: UDP-N-acetylmuramoyl-tripeptide-D-alanyl-D-alanine ligase [Candidatus Moranbacteria bacterium GW2011_GWA2_39_41]